MSELRNQLAATLYELVDDRAWEDIADIDKVDVYRIVDGLTPVFAEWLASIANQEVLIAHQRTEAGCLCGWTELDEHHSEHVLNTLAETLGGES